ncbi:serine hydrolase [Candidatus Solincola sp.]|nr:D-alanyl-D-alanine carboxypeptidase family protein [Actinomycetota bacterium]MDI7251576.1 D-alanyl-D-alanine carboxypeptidase family protein [Actinomycetota bacterium]
MLPRVLLLLLAILLVAGATTAWVGRGEEGRARVFELPASNLEDLREQYVPGGISEPDIPARAAVLMEAESGEILWEKNADLELPMASTTKIMTAVITLENASLDEKVVVSERASSTGESSAWLEKGEVLTVEQLLHALMVQSANDSAVALAEHVAGSVEAFVEMMNRKAVELGAEHTRFANPHGLDQRGHYTTARDLARIAAYAMRNPVFRELVISDGYQIPWPGHPYNRVMVNHNKFLKLYPYATGIKTGYTEGAGKCLVASAAKDGRELISVILNGGDSYWDQAVQLMDHGFQDFARVEYAYAGQPLSEVEVGDFPRKKVDAVAREDIAFTVRKDRLQNFFTAEVSCVEWVSYPVEKGREVGELRVGEGNPGKRTAVLVSPKDCRPPNPLFRLFAFLWAVLKVWWRWLRWLLPGV